MTKLATLVMKDVQCIFMKKTEPSSDMRKRLAFVCVFLLQLL